MESFLYHNLFEDVGFFDSFRPVWGWQDLVPTTPSGLSPLLTLLHNLVYICPINKFIFHSLGGRIDPRIIHFRLSFLLAMPRYETFGSRQ